MTPTIDWAKATVAVTVPVQHTATTETQTLDMPLKQFAAMLFDAESKRIRREIAKSAVARRAIPPAQEGDRCTYHQHGRRCTGVKFHDASMNATPHTFGEAQEGEQP